MRQTLDLTKEKSDLFLLYFYSALRSPEHGLVQANGSSHFEGDKYVSELSATFQSEGMPLFVVWKLIQSHNGRLLSVENLHPGDDAHELLLSRFINGILMKIVGESTDRYFKRAYFRAISGCNLPGEYWLPGFRFAPLYPEDDSRLVDAERIVVIDQNVDAVDVRHADEVAQTLARQYSAYLSFILDTPLEEPTHQELYLPNRNSGQYEMTRKSTQLIDSSGIDVMPDKAAICRLGEFQDSVFNPIRAANEYLVCPQETRRILRALQNADSVIQGCFLHSCLLYQLGGIAGRRYPTVKLPYEVAAVESIVKQHGTDIGSFTEFMNSYVKEDRELYDFLSGKIRSAHWHAGTLALGDLDFGDPSLASPGRHITFNVIHTAHARIRRAILSWLDEKVAFTNEST